MHKKHKKTYWNNKLVKKGQKLGSNRCQHRKNYVHGIPFGHSKTVGWGALTARCKCAAR